MTAPTRLQRLRSKGYRMPADAVYVGRPTVWGNPFPVASNANELFPRADAVRMFRELLIDGETTYRGAYGDEHRFTRSERRGALHVPTLDVVRRELAGRDLVCWCPLDVACHADVLLAIANGGSA